MTGGYAISSVVIGPDPARYRLVELITGVIGTPPVWSGGVAIWHLA